MASAPASLEALEEHAERVRAVYVARARASIAGEAESAGRPLDPSPLAGAYGAARAAGEDALATLFAEAWSLAACAPAARAYEAAWAAHPIVARPDPGDLAPRALVSVFALEPNVHRRVAIAAAADTLAQDRLPEARALVSALRDAAPALGVEAHALLAAQGAGARDHVLRASAAVLAQTEECFRELDAWARPRAGLARAGELAWHDRLRSLAMSRATELVPLGDRHGITSRWIARVGLGDALGRVRDATASPAIDGAGVRAFGDRAGDRGGVTIAGTGELGALGVVGLAGALAEALTLALPAEPRASERLGRDRVHHVVARALGRGLLADANFVVREASVDRAAREPVLLEFLHAELFFARLDAALARYHLDAFAHEPDLTARLRQYTQHAVGSAPAPAWAAHLAARSPELRSGPRALAAVLAPRLRDKLREAHDDDWWRNPRAGETLARELGAMRTAGAVAWAAGGSNEPDALAAALDGRALGAWAADALASAHR